MRTDNYGINCRKYNCKSRTGVKTEQEGKTCEFKRKSEKTENRYTGTNPIDNNEVNIDIHLCV